MSTSDRIPGSREEDAWLSDGQLKRVGPAEEEPFQAAVPTRMISNGEYMPHPQTAKQKHVEHRVKEITDRAAKRLGISRRDFVAGSGGMAASFLAMNEVYGKSFFDVDPTELYEPSVAAAHAPPRDLFVFDDQTHIVRSSTNTPQGLRALAQGPGPVSYGAGFATNPFNGTGGNPLGPDELGGLWTPWNPAQLGPDSPPNPGAATTGLTMSCSNPYLPASVVAACAANGITTFTFGTSNALLPRNISVHPTRTQFRGVIEIGRAHV